MTEVKVRGQGWCMYPELHEQVLRDLQTVSLSHSFHHEDDYSGCIKDYDTKIMGTFRCQHNRCRGSQWSSKHIAMTIRLYEGGTYNARVLSQLCGLCKNATRPQPDQTYVSRIAYRLKKWSGLDVEAPPYTKRSDECFNDRNLCQGCKHGHCNGRHFRMNFSEWHFLDITFSTTQSTIGHGRLERGLYVVGSGVTGSVIASRLSQSNPELKVILFEAGSDPSGEPAATTFLSGLALQNGQFDYAYASEPVPTTANRVHTLSAGKALGGGSILNYGGWLRADAADYDEWAEIVGDRRWSYKGLKPWLRKSETFHDRNADAEEHGFDGNMHVTSISASESDERKYPLREVVKDAWLELGVPLNLEKKQGHIGGLTEMYENSREGMRQPSNTAYTLSGVEVHTETVVHKIVFSGTTATGVELVDGRKALARKEVIICAGAYRTPQLLMLSGIGPSDVLQKAGISVVHEAPQVGQNLHDHFAIYLAFRLRDPSLGYAMGSPSWQNPALFKGLPWDWIASQSLPSEIIARHESMKDRQSRNLYEILTAYVPPGIPGIPVDGTHIATSTMLLLPTSRGSVSIRSNKPNDPPVVRPNYLSTALDRDTLVHAARETLQLMLATDNMKPIVESETPPSGEGLDGLQPLTADATDEELEERIRRTGMQHFHSGGTAAMGTVVDIYGKVFGVEKLRIADASIVPIPLGGHPQATLYAMAEQIASDICNTARTG